MGKYEAAEPNPEDKGDGGEDEDSDGLEAKGSDSEGEAAPKKAASARGRLDDDEGLWDPLAGLGARKKRKAAPGLDAATGPSVPSVASTAGQGRTKAASSTSGPPEGQAVCLFGLQKAPQLNGKLGTVAGPVDAATGRCPVLLADGTVKSLRSENLRPVLSGAVVRLKGLQSAAELNGQLAECGELDLTTERYNVYLADGNATLKKVKGDNIELVARYVSPVRYLAAQPDKRPFTWAEAVKRGAARERQSWSSQLALLSELGLPPPRFLEGAALAKA
ncbi:unnamed protein product, partial [Polarella glacialis]